MKAIPFTVNFQGRQVVAGRLFPNGDFVKNVEMKQRLHALNAYGLDAEYLEPAFAAGCKQIVLKERGTGSTFRISVEVFKKYAIKRNIGSFKNRWYCPLSYWKQIDKPVKQAQ